MTLLKITQALEVFSDEGTIYAATPWREDSKALVLDEPELGEVPSEAEKLGLTYFLEVSIARDFLEEWATSLDGSPMPQEKCFRLIQYAINDA